jgi:cell volume regulation protein A
LLGNADLPHRGATRSFVEGVAWLAQIGLFIMLGLLLTPERLTWHTIGIALVAGFILTAVARPLSVAVSSLVQRAPWRDQAFLSWAGLRGAVPIVFATIPLAAGVPGATQLFDIVFVLVVAYTLLTGPTLPWVARRLGLVDGQELRDLEVEAAPLERVAADLLQVRIAAESHLHGVEVGELRLPVGASISLVVRGESVLVPEPTTALRRGDDLIIVTPRGLRESTEERLRLVSRHGRLARWGRKA